MSVENEIPFAVPVSTATAKVVVNEEDVNEPPIFELAKKTVQQPEDLAVNKEVTQYTAYDPDTARKQTVM